jgi:hypothetical protein
LATLALVSMLSGGVQLSREILVLRLIQGQMPSLAVALQQPRSRSILALGPVVARLTRQVLAWRLPQGIQLVPEVHGEGLTVPATVFRLVQAVLTVHIALSTVLCRWSRAKGPPAAVQRARGLRSIVSLRV